MELNVHIFKVRVLGNTHSGKMVFKLSSSTQTREAAMSNFSALSIVVWHTSLLKTFAKIENFLGFHLARKSITLLFYQ